MNSEFDMVREFMIKHGHDVNVSLPEHVNVELQMIADRLFSFAQQLEMRLATSTDPRTLRAQLLCEELGEVIDAMAIGNELLLLDGLADVLYVVLGVAVAFDLPIVPAFHDVHRSNMTKQVGDFRVRSKGEQYQQPDLEKILCEHREQPRDERDEIIHDLLLLVDRDVPLEVIQSWHWLTGETVSEWAIAVHLAASDNDVEVPPEPLVVFPYRSKT